MERLVILLPTQIGADPIRPHPGVDVYLAMVFWTAVKIRVQLVEKEEAARPNLVISKAMH